MHSCTIKSAVRAASIALAFAASSGAWAQAQDAASWDLGGTISSEPYAAWIASNFFYGAASTASLVLDAKGDKARAEASIDTSVLTGAAAQEAWLLASTPYGRSDELLVPASAAAADSPEETAVSLRVRSLYLKLDLDWASLTAGRQFVNYGRGALWSPTDIFDELDLTGLSPERIGSDALRLSFPFGVTEGLDLVAAPTTAPADGRYALRGRALVGGVDGALVAARDGENRGWVAGADFKADIEIGLYGEATYELYDSGADGTLRAALGADYSFGDFIVAAEYYYNGGGAAADILFPGAHNAYGSITWKITEFFQLADTTVWNFSGGSGTSTLLASLSVAQNATLGAFVQGGYGAAAYGLDLGLGGSGWMAVGGIQLEVKF
jgi:hypothetical protein